MRCSQCGLENDPGTVRCKSCKAPLPQEQSPYQQQYRSSVPPTGQPQYGPTQSPYQQPVQTPYGQPPIQPVYVAPVQTTVISPNNRWVAFVLCFILGGLGIHRFYVGKIGTGILYLFTGGLCGIGWLVDLIMIACGSFTDQSGAFLKE